MYPPAVSYILAVFAMWLMWTLAEVWVLFPKWVWYLAMAGLGVGAQLLIEADEWYLGIGLGGATVFLYSLADLVLLATDWVKVGVLRNRGR